jgi:hypothetical protein
MASAIYRLICTLIMNFGFLQIYVLTIRGEVQDWNNPGGDAGEENRNKTSRAIQVETKNL